MPTQSSTRERIDKIITEQEHIHKERHDIIRGIWTALVARQHLLMIGPGGTGKSALVRDTATRITGSRYFEKALDETSTPDELLGPPDIKMMVEQGKTTRRVDGMLPEADIAFLDEFFNANGPTLHNTMPLLNERLHHNNGVPTKIPLRSAFMGTNKLNADSDMAALWDRVHHRHQISYVADRDNLRDLVGEAMQRRLGVEHGFTTITLEELDAAHFESLHIQVNDAVYDVFLNLIETLRRQHVVISTRRVVEGMAAVLATAWLNGHSDGVRVSDLSVLCNMFWNRQEEVSVVRLHILEATNPSEKKALDLLGELAKLKTEYDDLQLLDVVKRSAAAISIFKKVSTIKGSAEQCFTTSSEMGASTKRISAIIDDANNFRVTIGKDTWGIEGDALDTKIR